MEQCLFCLEEEAENNILFTITFSTYYPQPTCTCRLSTHVGCWLTYQNHKGRTECPICHIVYEIRNTNVVISNPVITNAVITNAVITNAAITNAAITNAAITNAAITNPIIINPIARTTRNPQLIQVIITEDNADESCRINTRRISFIIIIGFIIFLLVLPFLRR